MPILKDNVQILRVQEQSNTSQIAIAFGRRLGQFHVLAKGARRWPKKGFEGGFDLLARGELLAYPRPNGQLWIFKEWDERARPQLGQSYRMLAAGSFLCELTEALTRHTAGSAYEGGAPDDSSAKLYDVLAASSDALAARAAHPGSVLLGFTLRALECEGLLIPLNQCHVCGKKFFDGAKKAEPAWLSPDGLECKICVEKRYGGKGAAAPARGFWLGLEAHRALAHHQRTVKPLKLSEAAAQQLARALALLVHGALERDLRTLPYAMTWVKGMGKTVRTMTNDKSEMPNDK
ncbi:MAG TPA: DNA repair protein RecO C-terminal domain-containing protein [Planctomycetota bacterium]|nr:DNA repair protein RecO C-terminal domain-containing protein [Planctomycetota bacterium]